MWGIKYLVLIARVLARRLQKVEDGTRVGLFEAWENWQDRLVKRGDVSRVSRKHLVNLALFFAKAPWVWLGLEIRATCPTLLKDLGFLL